MFLSCNARGGKLARKRSGASQSAPEADLAGSDIQIPALLALHEASQQLLLLKDPEELAVDIIRILERLLTYEHLAVMLTHPKTGMLIPFAISDQGKGETFRESDKAYIESAEIQLGKGITGWVAERGESALVPDVSKDSRYVSLRPSIGSELCVPMILNERIIGVINVETSRLSAYTRLDQRVLETIASQIAIAIENARLFGEASRLRREAAMAEYAGKAIHDLGNLLSVINVDASRARSELSSQEKAASLIGQIETAAAEGAGLASRMLRTARTVESPDAPASLSKVVRDSQDLMRAVVGENIRFRTRIADLPLHVGVPRTSLEQALLNLVINASQAMEDGGELIVETGPVSSEAGGDSQCMLRVTDTGTGMSDSVRENAFHPYFSTREESGGLGLAIVARIVELAGGSALIDSAPGCGTAVTLRFPLLEPVAALAN